MFIFSACLKKTNQKKGQPDGPEQPGILFLILLLGNQKEE
jgi:hypothetical protein